MVQALLTRHRKWCCVEIVLWQKVQTVLACPPRASTLTHRKGKCQDAENAWPLGEALTVRGLLACWGGWSLLGKLASLPSHGPWVGVDKLLCNCNARLMYKQVILCNLANCL